MTPPTRKLVTVVGASLALVVVLLLLLPMFFGGRIAERAKAEANRALDATIDWRDASLGLLGDFPNLTLRLDGFSAVGHAPFAGDTLAAADELRIVLDLGSALRAALGGSAPVVIRAVELGRPRVRLLAREDGRANWQILKDTTSASEGTSTPFAVTLKRLAVTRGQFSLDDRASKLRATLAGLDETLSGDFAATQVAVDSRTHVDTATVDFAGIRYLNGVRLDLTVDANADMAKKRYELAKGTGLKVNDLQLEASGSAEQVGKRTRLDLVFSAPTTDFKSILSLVPAVYAHDFAAVKTTGTLAMKGQVRGEYGDGAFPAFGLDAKVENGTFRYPDLPLPATDIALDLSVSNPGGSTDSTVVNLRRLHVVLGANPVDASLVLRTPISDPDIDARVQGRVDLADLRRTVKLPDVQELSGTIAADAAVRTRLSWVDQGKYDRIAASGTLDVRDVAVQSAAVKHPVKVQQASLRLAPQRAELTSFAGTVGSSDLTASGELDNLLSYVFRDDDLRGSATVSSRKFVLDEWRSGDTTTGVIPVPPKLDLTLQATVAELLYGKVRMTDAKGRVRVKDQRITLDDFAMNTLGGSMAMSGFYETTVPTKPTFDFGLTVKTLDIPTAFAALTTVQALVPMAKYMQGAFSADLRLNGPLGQNLLPLFPQLTGAGTIQTTQVAITDFPPFAKAAAATKVALLNNPTLRAINSQFEVKDGRFRLKPFTVGIGSTTMTVSGSNGFDQTLDYDLKLLLPRALMGGANDALQGLVAKAASKGVDLKAAPEIALGITMRGTVTNPTIGTDVGASAGSAMAAAGNAVREAAVTKATAVVDSAKLRAAAAADKAVKEAEAKAAQVRADARALADKVTLEANSRADSLAAKAGNNPLQKLAADAAAKRLRKEGTDRAAQIVKEGDAKADALVAAAKGAVPAP